MLKLEKINKRYITGDLVQNALSDVSLSLRDNEFVSILGPSGSGKTTLLNVIGGLDRYDSGDLIINGISTKEYKDRDWDTYRNHTIGFVFQSYNLIPHQNVLSNVELALTISGVSRSERRSRAIKALQEVGLGDQLHKKPNQMSGGQMQRVAIARALVNDPDILLADEPTGALDSETSLQVMGLLKKVATNRLVVMVTHNPELANEYSTRIVKLRDGKIVEDSNPLTEEEINVPEPRNKERMERKTGKGGKERKAKMSFSTALSLSFNNLKTKKGRTIITSFAGSIGIIGIALILSLSSGVNEYINRIQKETMSSYPITIEAQTLDFSSLLDDMPMGTRPASEWDGIERTNVKVDVRILQTEKFLLSSMAENDLSSFKKYLDDPESDIRQYLGENGIIYTYHPSFEVYSYDPAGNLVNSDDDVETLTQKSTQSFSTMMRSSVTSMISSFSNSAICFQEIMHGKDGETISQFVKDNYELVYGSWPSEYNEIAIVLNEVNGIDIGTMLQLGFVSAAEYKELASKVEKGEKITLSFEYEEIAGHKFYLVPACNNYKESDGKFVKTTDQEKIENAIELQVSAIIRPAKKAKNLSILTPVGYTSKLVDYLIEYTDNSPVVKAQEAEPEKNILNGLLFEAMDDTSKIEETKKYVSAMGVSEKAELCRSMMSFSGDNSSKDMKETVLASLMDRFIKTTAYDQFFLMMYDQYIGNTSYYENLKRFGKISYDAPNSIDIYVDRFEDKDSVTECIKAYNEKAGDSGKIVYTDYIALITTSVTSIVNAISYVLIAFVAVSLVVSSIMIGIITHISVLERTKEIGILRAIGASKRNISEVFNAETFIIGLFSGIIGVGMSWVLIIPINAIIAYYVGNTSIYAILPVKYAIILVVISVLITLIGGLIPAKKAAKKDPVIALRTE